MDWAPSSPAVSPAWVPASPICAGGRERYVFFSFPHIAIDAEGNVGSISRPGRAGRSCACGALAKCLGEFKAEGYACNCKEPGIHDPLDPEYYVLKQRLARRLRCEQTDVSQMTLASITAVAERTITNVSHTWAARRAFTASAKRGTSLHL